MQVSVSFASREQNAKVPGSHGEEHASDAARRLDGRLHRRGARREDPRFREEQELQVRIRGVPSGGHKPRSRERQTQLFQ